MRLLLAILGFAWLVGCASTGEPLPPTLDIPQPVREFQVRQRGDRLAVGFFLPELTTDGLVVKRGEMELRAGPPMAPPFNADVWAGGAKAYPVRWPASEAAPQFVEAEIPAAEWAGKEVVVAVRLSNPKGRYYGWSAFSTLNVIASLAVPQELTARNVAEGVLLAWKALDRPGVRYRVFRLEGGQSATQELGTVEQPQYLDRGTRYGTAYQYGVLAVLAVGDRDAESEATAPVAITPRDEFAPAAPAGVAALAGAQSVELTWERNAEADFSGYRVYRSTGGEFVRLAETGAIPSYSDRKVKAGGRYRYAVTAVDQLGNESPRTATAEVVLP